MRRARGGFLTAVLLLAVTIASAEAGGDEDCGADEDEGPGPCGTVLLSTSLNGANERPGPGDPDATGTAFVVIDLCASNVCLSATTAGVDGTFSGLHIHVAPPTDPGPIVVPFSVPTQPSFGECVAVNNAELLQDLADNPENYYLNLHSIPTYPAGAIRGQLVEAN